MTPWRRRISAEFDAPTIDVIKSFAESGYSKRLTAAALGIGRSTLLDYARRRGIVFKNRKELRPECKPVHGGKGGWPKGKTRNNPIRLSDAYILSCVREADYGPQIRGVSLSTVCKRFRTWRHAKRLAMRAA